jgi:GNAT superfamily N-acetyltransferase
VIVVRDATPSDVPAIARVHVESRRRALAGVLPPVVADAWTVEERVATWSGVLADPALGTRAFARVAVAGGDVVGLGNAGALPVDEPGFRGEVARLYVAPAWQRRGVGRALFLSLAAGLDEAGLAPFLLWTVARNAPARAFYVRMGGRLAGTVTVPSRGGVLVEKVSYGWDRAPAR